jgi:DNA gyrase inhibitor GyrI
MPVSLELDEIRIVTLEPMRVARYCVVSSSPEQESRAFIERWAAQQGVADPARRRSFGSDVRVSPEQQAAGMRGYERMIPVTEAAQPSEGVSVGPFTGGRYAALHLARPFDDPATISEGWDELIEWVRRHRKYTNDGWDGLEEYLEGPDGPVLELLLPIQEKCPKQRGGTCACGAPTRCAR